MVVFLKRPMKNEEVGEVHGEKCDEMGTAGGGDFTVYDDVRD